MINTVIIPYFFRFVFYTFFGLSLEIIFSVTGIEKLLGTKINKRCPENYLEGFVSLYMIPLHGLGLLFGFEFLHNIIANYFLGIRFIIWALLFTICEIIWGFVLDKIIGFYPWNYYAYSKYKIFNKGYSLWTLIPMWGIAGIFIEYYSQLLIYLSPYATKWFISL